MNYRISLCVLCVLCGESLSAPPAVTSLLPPGCQRGTVADVTATGTFDAWPVHVWSSDAGIHAVAEKDKGKFRVAVGPAVVPGVHWLRFYDATGASALRPFVVGTLPDVAEKEPNDDPAKAQPVTGNAVVNGKLEKTGDVDCYSVPLKAGQTLVAAVEAHATLRSPIDTVLQIVSPAGQVLAQNHDHRGLDPLVTFPAPTAGTYVVRLFAFPAAPDSSIRHFGSDTAVYRLTLTTGPYADHPTPLAATRGRTIISVQGWNNPAPARLDRERDGFATARSTNPLRVRVEGHPCYDTTLPGPLPPVAAPVSITGHLSRPNRANLHPVTLNKGTPITVTVESATFGLPVVPVVRVLDTAGKQIARGEPKQLHEDTSVPFVPAAGGTYGIEVRDLYGAAGDRHFYLVRVVPTEPDFTATTPTDRLTLVPGKPLDVPVALSKLNGFDGDVDLKVEGLPSGVAIGTAPPPAKPDPKTLALRLSAEPMTWSGPVRIVGFPKGKTGPARVVRAPNAEFDQPTTDLWLTISADAAPVAPEKPKKK